MSNRSYRNVDGHFFWFNFEMQQRTNFYHDLFPSLLNSFKCTWHALATQIRNTHINSFIVGEIMPAISGFQSLPLHAAWVYRACIIVYSSSRGEEEQPSRGRDREGKRAIAYRKKKCVHISLASCRPFIWSNFCNKSICYGKNACHVIVISLPYYTFIIVERSAMGLWALETKSLLILQMGKFRSDFFFFCIIFSGFVFCLCKRENVTHAVMPVLLVVRVSGNLKLFYGNCYTIFDVRFVRVYCFSFC